MSNNYPLGSENDPSAPWNYDDSCPECITGRMKNIFADVYKCSKCGYMEQDGKDFIDEEIDV